MYHDLVLEQYLPPSLPLLAGFQLDAFSVIKPRITRSPSSDADIWDISITCLEDKHISPAVLFIQVSAVQVSLKPAFMVHVNFYMEIDEWMYVSDMVCSMLFKFFMHLEESISIPHIEIYIRQGVFQRSFILVRFTRGMHFLVKTGQRKDSLAAESSKSQ